MNSQKSDKISEPKNNTKISRCRRKVKWRLKQLSRAELWASPRGFGVVAAVIAIMWIANFFAMPILFAGGHGGMANAGIAGDMFGGLTALFSGLAFAGLITTLFMQRKELSLQRSEIRLQRQELSQTREVFQIQRFENTFFGLLNLLEQHLDSVVWGYAPNALNGRRALNGYAGLLPSCGQLEKGQHGETEKPNTRNVDEVVKEFQDKYFVDMESDLGPYFRIMDSILRHIEDSSFTEETGDRSDFQKKYADIVSSKLSSAENKLLLYFCASPIGRTLKPRVERLSVLKFLTKSDYTGCKKLVQNLDKNAFRFSYKDFEETKKLI